MTVKASSDPPTRQTLPTRTLGKSTLSGTHSHSTIWGMDTQGRGARRSQNSIVRRCWKRAKGEVEWGHRSPEEARTQEERGIEGFSQAEKTEEKSSEFLSSPPTLKINVRKWAQTEAGDTQVRQ